MKHLLFIILFFFSQIFFSQEYLEMIESNEFTVNEIIEKANDFFINLDEKETNSSYRLYKRWEYWALKMMDENGFLATENVLINELEKTNSLFNKQRATITTADNWANLGPSAWSATSGWNPGIGRITSISIDKNDSNHILIGSVSGGVWVTRDGGDLWTPLTDFFICLDVYSVLIDPLDATHYLFGSHGNLYQSMDEGATWSLLANIGTSFINKIVIHPDSGNILFASLQNEGIFKSLDAGVNWEQVSADPFAYDIEFNTDDSSIIYISGSEFYKSIDNGMSFTKINGFNTGAKMIAVTDDDPNYVYVLEANNNIFGGLYISTDAGDSFIKINHGSKNFFGYSSNAFDNEGQAPRDMDIAVNLTNKDEVHIAGINSWVSFDAGENFQLSSYWKYDNIENIGYCHADVDIMVFDGNTLYIGTDGGIYKVNDTSVITEDYFTDISKGISIKQFYKLGITQSENVIISAGAQDNGTSRLEANVWTDWLGADGMESIIANANPDYMFGTSQFGQVYNTYDSGINVHICNIPESESTGNWVSPLENDPNLDFLIFLGHDRLYRSTTLGYSWFPISQRFGSPIEVFKISPSNTSIMYIADDYDIYKTIDAGATDWIKKTAPGGFINSIAVHPNDSNKVAVATTSGNKVYVSYDGGESWISFKKNLPDLSALTIVWDDNGKDGLYLGMTFGVYYIDNTVDEWQNYSNNLPNVKISELEINKIDQKIYIATYGRGIWSSPIMYNTLYQKEKIAINDLKVSPIPFKSKIKVEYKHLNPIDLSIFNEEGKRIIYKRKIILNNPYYIDMEMYNAGIYYLKINSEKGSLTKKIIKI